MASGVKSTGVPRTSRTERARATRTRMLRAAYSLFAAHGYPAVTMAAVAAEAGVAVQTLYFTFGTKAQLLQHVYDYAVLGDGEVAPPAEQPWYRAMHAAEDLAEALRILVENVGVVMARTAPLDEFVRAASIEPEPARVRQATESRRRAAWRDMIESLSGRFPLRPGLTPERATDVLMVVMSPSTYQGFVGNYGWTPAEWQQWCAQALSAQVFAERRSADGV